MEVGQVIALIKSAIKGPLQSVKSDIHSVESAIDGINIAGIDMDMYGFTSIANKNHTGSATKEYLLSLDLVNGYQYTITVKLQSAISGTVYFGLCQSDGTLIGYSDSISSGSTYALKNVSISSDYKNAKLFFICSVDCVVAFASVAANNSFVEQVANSMIGDDVTELAYTSTQYKQINGKGEVVDSDSSTYYVTNDIEIKEKHWYMITSSAGYSASYYAILDSNHNTISNSRSPGGSATANPNRMVFTPLGSKYIRIAYVNSVTGCHIAVCNTLKTRERKKHGWSGEFLAISYSNIGVSTINTIETYLSAGHFGFNVCKGDVRPTSDGKLIMCHDPGFTFDGNGRITDYNSSNKTLIHDMTYETAMSKEYAGNASASNNNHYQKVADIDGFLDACKQYGMIAFITVRDEYISTVCSEVMSALKRHGMMERAIINSYTPAMLSAFRFADDNIPLSFIQSDNASVTTSYVNRFAPYGNMYITLVSSVSDMKTYITGLKSVLDHAREKGIGIMFSLPSSMADVFWLRDNGIAGAQIGAVVMPYNFSQVKFKVKLASGTATVQEWNNVETMETTVSQSGNVISVSAFTIAGSGRGFPDLIMDAWMNKFAKRITAVSENGNNVTAIWQNNALKLTVSDINTDDTVDVIVEV